MLKGKSLFRRINMKKFITKPKVIITICIIAILAVIVSNIKIQSVDEYYMEHATDISEDSETVYLTILCDTVFDNMDKLNDNLEQYIPKDGVILKRTEYVLRQGDTVFDVLQRATSLNKIQMEYQGADSNIYGTAYVEGINYLYEFSCGNLSGWMYMVNGEFAQYGCSNYVLKDGDDIKWVYTCDLGEDVKKYQEDKNEGK